MNRNLMATGILAGILVAGGAIGMAWADAKSEPPSLSEAQVIDIALAEVPGEVQETELEIEDGKQVYEVEILNASGVEVEVEIDAQTGAILEIETEDDDDQLDG